MPSENGTYSTSEKQRYTSEPCPQCGGETRTQWIRSRDLDTTEDRWLPGPVSCANPGSHTG
jgi:hypothetical protein